MQFKVRADVTLSKVLTIEADNLGEAMDKARQQMQGRINTDELEFSDLAFELLSHAIGDEGLVETGRKKAESQGG